MVEQLLLFSGAAVNVEATIQKILTLRRRYGCSGQHGLDTDLIRAALIKGAA